MLQSTFLPARALGCTAAEREAAIEVLHRLESEQIRSMTMIEHLRAKMLRRYPTDAKVLYMGEWHCDRGRCGTAACLGGWIEIALNGGHRQYGISDLMIVAWKDVFYPKHWDAARYTTERAAKALRAKLETGKADWT